MWYFYIGAVIGLICVFLNSWGENEWESDSSFWELADFFGCVVGAFVFFWPLIIAAIIVSSFDEWRSPDSTDDESRFDRIAAMLFRTILLPFSLPALLVRFVARLVSRKSK